MPKNFQIHLRIETPITDQLKRQALEEGISFGELCRRKLKKTPQLSLKKDKNYWHNTKKVRTKSN